jgi:hypothetical protein
MLVGLAFQLAQLEPDGAPAGEINQGHPEEHYQVFYRPRPITTMAAAGELRPLFAGHGHS